MDKYIINGGKKLSGSVSISGSKNASLPIIFASLLGRGKSRFHKVPELADIRTTIDLMEFLNAEISLENGTLDVDTSKCDVAEGPYKYVKRMRASIYILGPLLALHKKAMVSLPGGCAWGPRPVNLHIKGMQKLGADIKIEKGYIIAETDGLKGAHITLDVSSVGATGNILMAAVLAKGNTTIVNAAMEPEIQALANFLNEMGAKIEGIGSPILRITGVDEMGPIEHTMIPDRIETGTLLCAGAITKSKIRLTECEPAHLDLILEKLLEMGCSITTGENWIELDGSTIGSPLEVVTSIYPGFPTDMQPQFVAVASLLSGTSRFKETIYFDRFTNIPELNRLGANIVLEENIAVVEGVEQLSGAEVMASDIRAGASLVLAGLAAKGQTEIERIYHIDRGYEKFEDKLQALGADIQRVKGGELY